MAKGGIHGHRKRVWEVGGLAVGGRFLGQKGSEWTRGEKRLPASFPVRVLLTTRKGGHCVGPPPPARGCVDPFQQPAPAAAARPPLPRQLPTTAALAHGGRGGECGVRVEHALFPCALCLSHPRSVRRVFTGEGWRGGPAGGLHARARARGGQSGGGGRRASRKKGGRSFFRSPPDFPPVLSLSRDRSGAARTHRHTARRLSPRPLPLPPLSRSSCAPPPPPNPTRPLSFRPPPAGRPRPGP